MAVEFHEADDEHAPFPHRVIILAEKTVKIRFRYAIHYPRQEFVICAECDHWINTNAPCKCPQRCHDLGALLREIDERNETGSSDVPPDRIDLDPEHGVRDREARS